MKATGVLRRIDDLGRVVIPKEIRKNLKIRDGEPLEILVNDNEIILKKHSLIDDINNIAKICIESISDVNTNIMVTDREKIIAVTGPLKKKYNEKQISEDISNLIFKRNTYKESNGNTINIIPDESENGRYIITPIIADGDPVGAVILLTTDRELSDIDDRTVQYISKFLGKYIE